MSNDFEKYGISTSKRLGQNFLTDKIISHKITKQFHDLENKTVLEIVGSGMGGLTEPLLETKAKKLLLLNIIRDALFTYMIYRNNFQISFK